MSTVILCVSDIQIADEKEEKKTPANMQRSCFISIGWENQYTGCTELDCVTFDCQAYENHLFDCFVQVALGKLEAFSNEVENVKEIEDFVGHVFDTLCRSKPVFYPSQ